MTTTNVKDVLHLYLGCDAEIVNDGTTMRDKITTSTIDHKDTWKVIPILRPLSDLTEAEQEQWNQISTPIGEMAIESAMQIHWAKRLNFYRSIGIDCDQLLESGQAINKTTLKR